MTNPISSAIMTEQRMPNRAPFFARSYCFAPRFWLTNVVSAIVKQVTGRKAKPSIFAYEPQPAIAIFPNALMFVCTKTFAIEITEFWKPDGTPFRMISPSTRPSKPDFADVKPVLFFRPQQMDHTENRTCELGNDRCKCRCSDTHAEARR